MNNNKLILAIFLSHSYNGQGSRGYRILCQLMDHYNLTWNVKEEYRATQTELYNKLVKKYSDFI